MQRSAGYKYAAQIAPGPGRHPYFGLFSHALAPLFVAVTMSLITVMLAKIPGRFYSRLLLLPLSFAMLSAGVVAFMHGSGQTLFALDVLGCNWAFERMEQTWPFS